MLIPCSGRMSKNYGKAKSMLDKGRIYGVVWLTKIIREGGIHFWTSKI